MGCENLNCSQICTLDNLKSNATCKCYKGYQLNADGKTCVDINECHINNGGCSDNCTNLSGSYACTCSVGKYLSSDFETCERNDFLNLQFIYIDKKANNVLFSRMSI